MSSLELDLGKAIKDNSIIVDEILSQRRAYDYAGVFWNSVYGVGLVGLGWVSIKLGKLIAEAQGQIQKIEEFVWDPYEADPTMITEVQYNTLYPWCDPAGDKYTANPPSMPIGVAIKYYRENPIIWQEIKAYYTENSANVGPAGAPIRPASVKALDLLDGVYARVGPVLPVGILSYNCLAEYIRVKRMKEVSE